MEGKHYFLERGIYIVAGRYLHWIDTKISIRDRYHWMTVLNADMQGEGRGTFLCLLGVCLIAIAAAAALDPWSLGSQIITDQE